MPLIILRMLTYHRWIVEHGWVGPGPLVRGDL